MLALPGKWPVWLFAALVAGNAAVAVVACTHIDIGPVAGLPNMYEPSWGPPGKLLSAVAEGLGRPAPPLGRRRRRPRHGAGMPDAGAGVVPDR